MLCHSPLGSPQFNDVSGTYVCICWLGFYFFHVLFWITHPTHKVVGCIIQKRRLQKPKHKVPDTSLPLLGPQWSKIRQRFARLLNKHYDLRVQMLTTVKKITQIIVTATVFSCLLQNAYFIFGWCTQLPIWVRYPKKKLLLFGTKNL